MDLSATYRKYGAKVLIIPVVIFAVFTFIALVNPGVSYGVDFRGGILISFSSDQQVSTSLAQKIREEIGVSEVSVIPTEVPGAGEYGGIVEVVYPEGALAKSVDEFKERVLEIIKSEVPNADNFVVRDVSPTLGAKFWDLATKMLLWAVVLLKAVVLFAFRRNIPFSRVLGVVIFDLVVAGWGMGAPFVALAVVIASTIFLTVSSPDATPTILMLGSSLFNAIGILALMAVFDVPISLQTLAIMLMMVGYSIDTDIVLSTHLLKRSEEEGDEFDRAGRAASTGLHMSGTTLVAMLFILAVGYLTRNISVIRIGMVMIFGVLSDVIITWLFNAPIMVAWVRKYASTTR